MRANIYKEKILTLLKKKHLLSISEIHKAVPGADYSTIYRNVEQLLSDKKIKKVLIDNKSIAYESTHKKHDHFICNDCGKVEEINIPYKFITNHDVEDITVRGSCNDCIN